jgi:anti-sigma regulatory factor (Ser/Thr protein kinase)
MPFQITVPAGPAAPTTARRALTRWLSTRSVNGLLSDAPLIVSELVTNSMRHAGLRGASGVRVSAALANGVLRIEVEDGGTGGAVVRRAPNRDHGGGFGLNIVDSLALRWGVERARGTMVWVELAAVHAADDGPEH